MRQNHRRKNDPPAHRGHRGSRAVQRSRRLQPEPLRTSRRKAPYADHLPGPLQFAEPPNDRGGDAGRSAKNPQTHRSQQYAGAGGRTSRHGGPPSRPRPPVSPRIQRRPAPAHRHFAGPGRESGIYSLRTNPSPPWMCLFRRKSSIFSRIFKPGSALPFCSSRTT